MASASFSKISQNDKDAFDIEPAEASNNIYAETHIRGTVFSICRSKFGNSRYGLIASSLISIMAAAILFLSSTQQTHETTQQYHDNSTSSWAPPPVNWDVIEKQAWGHVETDRPGEIFRSEFVSGVTYMQKTDVDIQQVFPVNGKTFDSRAQMEVENSMFVSDSSGGGKQFEITLNRVAMTQDTMGIKVEYDSEEPNNESNLLTDKLGDLVGKTATINTDDKCQIMRKGDTGAQGTEETSDNSITASSQFELVSRMTKALPEESVQPGDEWDIQIDLEGFEEIDGHAQLLGYIKYDGADCAVILMNGTVAFDVSAMIEGIDGNFDDDTSLESMNTMQVEDGKMSSVMYWDHQENLARFTEVNLSMTLHVQNPDDTSSDFSDRKDESIPSSFIDVPTFEYMQIYLGKNEEITKPELNIP